MQGNRRACGNDFESRHLFVFLGEGPPFGLVAFYFDAFGHHFDFNSPFNLFLLKQLLRFSSELAPGFGQYAATQIPFNRHPHELASPWALDDPFYNVLKK